MLTQITAGLIYARENMTAKTKFEICLYLNHLWDEFFYETYCSVKEREDNHKIFFKRLMLYFAEQLATYDKVNEIYSRNKHPEVERKEDSASTIDDIRVSKNLQWFIHRIGIEYQQEAVYYHFLFSDITNKNFLLKINKEMLDCYEISGLEEPTIKDSCADFSFKQVRFSFDEGPIYMPIRPVPEDVRCLKFRIEDSEKNAFLSHDRLPFFPHICRPVNRQFMEMPAISKTVVANSIFSVLGVSYSYKEFSSCAKEFSDIKGDLGFPPNDAGLIPNPTNKEERNCEKFFTGFFAFMAILKEVEAKLAEIIDYKNDKINLLAKQRAWLSWSMQEAIRQYYVLMRIEFTNQNSIDGNLASFFTNELVESNSFYRIKFVDLTGKDLDWLIKKYNALIRSTAALTMLGVNVSARWLGGSSRLQAHDMLINVMKETLDADINLGLDSPRDLMGKFFTMDRDGVLSLTPEQQVILAEAKPEVTSEYFKDRIKEIGDDLNLPQFISFLNIGDHHTPDGEPGDSLKSALNNITNSFAIHKNTLDQAMAKRTVAKKERKIDQRSSSRSSDVSNNREAADSPRYEALLKSIDRILEEVSWWGNQVRGCCGGDVVVSKDGKEVPVPRGVAIMKHMKDLAPQTNMPALAILENYRKVADQRLSGCNWPKFFHVRVDATTKCFYELLLNFNSNNPSKTLNDAKAFFNQKIGAKDPESSNQPDIEKCCSETVTIDHSYLNPSSSSSSSPSSSSSSSSSSSARPSRPRNNNG